MLTLLMVAMALGATSIEATAQGAEACVNEARRLEQGSGLSNCRAYELVTPAAKDSDEPRVGNGGDFANPGMEGIQGAHAGSTGDRMAWSSEYALPGSPFAGLGYLSTRTAEGWVTESVIPPQSVENGALCPELVGVVGWSADLSKGILADGDAQEGSTGFYEQGLECGHAEPRLTPSQSTGFMEMEGMQNLFQRGGAENYQLIDPTPDSVIIPTTKELLQNYFPANYMAGSANLAHVVFEEELPLTPEAEELSPRVEEACEERERTCWEGHDDLYEWSEDEQPAVRMVSILPDGASVEGQLAGATRNASGSGRSPEALNVAGAENAMSASGERVFFEAEGDLYVRVNGDEAQSAIGSKEECTETAKACTVELDKSRAGGAGGGGKFMAASADGTRVFFTDGASADLTSSTVHDSGTNLYEYDLPAEVGVPGQLTDLTPSSHAAVLGVSGAGESGAYVYFVAEGALAAGQNSAGATAEEGHPNLYLDHEQKLTFIAALSSSDSCDWASNAGCASGGLAGLPGLTARVAGDGEFIGFNSVASLTLYDNVDISTAKADDEIFLFDARTGDLSCVSCDPSGPPSEGGAAIRWPALPDTNAELRNAYPQHNVSDSGQVFFETSEAELTQDTDGVRDVYEYVDGHLSELSSGASPAGSYFMDATPSGNDVFFTTTQSLLPRDVDSVYDIYDARAGGGFVEPAAPKEPCNSEEECRGQGFEPSALAAPASYGFVGPDSTATQTSKRQKTTKGSDRKKKLARKLNACKRKKNKRKRARCARQVRKRYGKPSKPSGVDTRVGGQGFGGAK
ncbi:MAG TPA: hypothetical protein VGF95_01305 [Solirubrobacteraceae bacterium]